MNEKNDSGINKGNKPVITNVESGEIQLDKPDTIDQQFLYHHSYKYFYLYY